MFGAIMFSKVFGNQLSGKSWTAYENIIIFNISGRTKGCHVAKVRKLVQSGAGYK